MEEFRFLTGSFDGLASPGGAFDVSRRLDLERAFLGESVSIDDGALSVSTGLDIDTGLSVILSDDPPFLRMDFNEPVLGLFLSCPDDKFESKTSGCLENDTDRFLRWPDFLELCCLDGGVEGVSVVDRGRETDEGRGGRDVEEGRGGRDPVLDFRSCSSGRLFSDILL